MNVDVPQPVMVEMHDGVAVLSLSAPHGNALSPPVRAALAAEIDRAVADDAVRAIALSGSGRFFSSDPGLDTTATLEDAPSLADLCARIEAAPKPVVAGLGGLVAGPGLELALAAHYRVAHPATRLHLPGAGWGLPPAAGTTQRLPRMVGATLALAMLLDGRILTAEEAADAGLVDRVTSGPRGAALVAFAAEAARGPLPPPPRDRPSGLSNPEAFLAAIERRRPGASPVAQTLLRLVEAALMLPFEAGLEMERAAHADALSDPTTAALMHVARIEARPLVPGATPRPVMQVAVLGAEDGAGLAAQCLGQGLHVTLADPDEALLKARAEVIGTALERGNIDAGQLLRLSTNPDLCEAADLVIVPGTTEIAAEYLRLAGLRAKPTGVIAAFGAPFDPAPLTARPETTVWVHWPMVEGMRRHAALCSDGVLALATVAGLVRRFGRHPIRAAAPPDRPALALHATLLRTVERLLLRGVAPGRIDAALTARGWKGGPCVAFDAMGLDTAAALAGRAADSGWAPDPLGVAETLAEAGLSGRAAGQGLYRHADGAPQETSAALTRAISGAGEDVPDAAEIADRVLAALAVCGLRLIRDGAVASAAEVDLAALHVVGVPRDSGGPMAAADRRGVLWLRGVLRSFAEDDPDLWERLPEIDRMIRDGRRLSGPA